MVPHAHVHVELKQGLHDALGAVLAVACAGVVLEAVVASDAQAEDMVSEDGASGCDRVSRSGWDIEKPTIPKKASERDEI